MIFLRLKLIFSEDRVIFFLDEGDFFDLDSFSRSVLFRYGWLFFKMSVVLFKTRSHFLMILATFKDHGGYFYGVGELFMIERTFQRYWWGFLMVAVYFLKVGQHFQDISYSFSGARALFTFKVTLQKSKSHFLSRPFKNPTPKPTHPLLSLY